ncbi:hypothetical protein ACJBSC_11345, partial [Streptococcus suis]
ISYRHLLKMQVIKRYCQKHMSQKLNLADKNNTKMIYGTDLSGQPFSRFHYSTLQWSLFYQVGDCHCQLSYTRR